MPAFYERDAHDIPRRWLKVVKESIRTVLPMFSTCRMMKQYVEEMYTPAFGSSAAGRPGRLTRPSAPGAPTRRR